MWDSTDLAERMSYADGKLYAANHHAKWVSCANATTGTLIWNYTLPDTAEEYDDFYQHPVIADGKVYFALSSNKLECLDANNGDFLWEYVSQGNYVENLGVAYGRVYLIGGSEAKLYCLDAASGTQLWEFQASGPIDYYNPVIAEGLIYLPAAALMYEGFPTPELRRLYAMRKRHFRHTGLGVPYANRWHLHLAC